MKVLKFGGTSVGSPERIRHVANLIRQSGRNIVVLSAMSGTTNTLVEIADYLYKRNIPGAQDTINQLRAKYQGVVDELYSSDDTKARISDKLERTFQVLTHFTNCEFTAAEEKEILACGELISTTLMQGYFEEIGVRSVLIPALDLSLIHI